MSDGHSEEMLIAYARGDVHAGERARVEDHVAGCPQCRAALDGYQRILAELARPLPPAPPIHWGAYRAELREKLERRRARRRTVWAEFIRPAPALVAAGLLAVLVYAGLPGLPRERGTLDPLDFDHAVLASRLDLIAQLDVVQRLDLLEDFTVIRDLDELPWQGKS